MRFAILCLLFMAFAIGSVDAGPFTGALAPPGEIASLVLPQGRLGGSWWGQTADRRYNAVYVDLDHIDHSHTGHIRALLFWVYSPGIPTLGRVAIDEVERRDFDCSKHSTSSLGAQAFDEHGDLAIWLPAEISPAPVVTSGPVGAAEAILCRGSESEPGHTVMGYRAAVADAREVFRADRRDRGNEPG
jgi:hypothetical protein